MILLATHRSATEIDRLIDVFIEREAPFFRLNMGWGESYGAVLAVSSNADVRLHAECDGRSLDGTQITRAWYHQPPILEIPDESSRAAGRAAVTSSIVNFWTEALEALSCVWLNAPRATHIASNKVRQLLIAQEVGLNVAPTAIGLGAAMLREHLAGSAVMKSLADVHQVWGERSDVSFLTAAVALDDIPEAAMQAIPALYQSRLTPVREYRIVVVEDQMFTASVDEAVREGAVDIRTVPNVHTLFAPAEVPTGVRDGLLRMLARCDLSYCSADFIQSDDGAVYFIDLNVCGSWWWVDDLYHGAVTARLADAMTAQR